ncbi:MAG: hypothetical protein ACYC65_11880, partial [Candidatus Limnocylindrales bacterium]
MRRALASAHGATGVVGERPERAALTALTARRPGRSPRGHLAPVVDGWTRKTVASARHVGIRQ